MTLPDERSTRSLAAVLTPLWTVFALLVALTAATNGTILLTIWWAAFPVGWILARRRGLSERRQRAVLVGLTLAGNGLVVVGAWLAWPSFGPFHTGGVPLIHLPTIEQGFQAFDAPLIAIATAGSVGAVRDRRDRRGALLALAAGCGVFLWTVLGPWFARGLQGFSWGYYVTLGGAVCSIYAGLVRLSIPRRRPLSADTATRDVST